MSSERREAELSVAAEIDERGRCCLAVARSIRIHGPYSAEAFEYADRLTDMANTCAELAEILRTPTVGEFIALAKIRKALRANL